MSAAARALKPQRAANDSTHTNKPLPEIPIQPVVKSVVAVPRASARRSKRKTSPRHARKNPTRPARRVLKAHKAATVRLKLSASIDDAMAVIMTACRDHWGRNLQAACAGQREALHQARVGFRRVRTALALFRDYIPPSQYDHLRAEAKVLNEALGPARDLDVFIGDLGQSRSRKPVTDSDTTAISRAAEEAHATAYRNVASTFRGARYRRFMVRLDTWLIGRRWRVGKQRAKDGSRQARDFACKILNKRIAQIQKQTKSLEYARPKVLHAMRIAIKKARYGLEFFTTLLPTTRAARTGRHLRALQDALGALNDRDVAHRTVATLIASADDKKQRRAIKNEAVKLTARLKSSAKASLARAAKAGAHLRFQERF